MNGVCSKDVFHCSNRLIYPKVMTRSHNRISLNRTDWKNISNKKQLQGNYRLVQILIILDLRFMNVYIVFMNFGSDMFTPICWTSENAINIIDWGLPKPCNSGEIHFVWREPTPNLHYSLWQDPNHWSSKPIHFCFKHVPWRTHGELVSLPF